MIYIVRHGQTDWNVEGRNQGRIDVELNQKGIEQALKMKDKLKDIKFDKVFSSPLKRAYKTAQIITSNEIIVDNRIIERCNGKLEGKLKNEINVDIDFNDPHERRMGIENIIDFRNRINDFLEEILKKYKGKNVLVVTHAGVSIYVRCFFEGEPSDSNYNALKLNNCEVLEYNYWPQKKIVLKYLHKAMKEISNKLIISKKVRGWWKRIIMIYESLPEWIGNAFPAYAVIRIKTISRMVPHYCSYCSLLF